MMIKALAVAAVVLLLLVTAASCVVNYNEGPPGTGNVNIGKAELTVIRKDLQADASGNVTLLVTIQNTGTATAEWADVQVKFYDKNGNVIDTGRDSVLNLQPGDTWDFSFPCDGSISAIAKDEVTATAVTSSGQ